jgi:hypothetical protein
VGVKAKTWALLLAEAEALVVKRQPVMALVVVMKGQPMVAAVKGQPMVMVVETLDEMAEAQW